jgi:hypothetical protein
LLFFLTPATFSMGTLLSPSQECHPFYPSSLSHDLVVRTGTLPGVGMGDFISLIPDFGVIHKKVGPILKSLSHQVIGSLDLRAES